MHFGFAYHVSSQTPTAITNSDYGQANVVLATAHALGLASQDVEIHIASFQDLQDGVNDASRFMQAEAVRKKLTVPKSTEIRKTAEQVASRHRNGWVGKRLPRRFSTT
jgi:hypothetical protein